MTDTTPTPDTSTDTRLLIVILRGHRVSKLRPHLLDAGFRVTEFSSLGGFLRQNSTTLLVGVAADEVEHALDLIRTHAPTPKGAPEHTATIFQLAAGQFVSL